MASNPLALQDSQAAGSPSWPRSLRYVVIVLLFLGVAWRALRYFLQFPVWSDEAYLCLNFLDRDLVGMTQPLRYVQVAPILFLWLEWFAHHWLGPSELALRLLPFLASIAALLLFWRLARRALDPLAAALAVGLLAVSYYPVRHGCEIKPYSIDLLVSVALLLLTVRWLQNPQRLGPLVGLTLLAPVTMALSYPSVFVAGSVSLVLLPILWRQPRWGPRLLGLAFNLLLLVGFASVFWLVARGQYHSAGGKDNCWWQDAFPPAQLGSLLKWLALAHTGNLMAYPTGGPNGFSLVTLLLCLAGVWKLYRSGRGALLALCLLPFGLTMIAAALHKYPYGGSARVAQHLAPAICLLAGAGVAALIQRFASSVWQARWIGVAFGLLILIGVGGLSRDLFKPQKTEGDRTVRQVVTQLFDQARPQDLIFVIPDHLVDKGATFEWYLRQKEDRITWSDEMDLAPLAKRSGEVWCICFSYDTAAQLRNLNPPRGCQVILIDHQQHTVQLGKTENTIEHCELFRWKCLRGEGE